MIKKFIKNFIIYLILTAFLNQQVCFAMSIFDGLQRENLAPVVQVNSDNLKNFFKNTEQIELLTENSFVFLTNEIKEDKVLYGLYNKLNKLGQLNEKETILSLLVMANGINMPAFRLSGLSRDKFQSKLKKYDIKDDCFSKADAREIFIKSGLAELRPDGTLYIEMGNMVYGLSRRLMEALGPKLIVKHKLYDKGQLGRFEGEAYRFTDRPNADVEVTVEYGNVTAIKFLSDNTFADKIARIYDEQGRLIDATRKLGVKLKDLRNNTVILELSNDGVIPVGEETGARLKWGKHYTHYDGREFDLEGKTVRLTINYGVVVKAVLAEQNIDLPLNIVYESATHLPVYSSVSKIASERMAGFHDHYVIGRLSRHGTLEAGGKTWCSFMNYPNFRVKYFLDRGWISEVEVYDEKNNFIRQKTINLVYDKKGNIVDFLRKMTLESIAKLSDHTIDYTLYRDSIFIANEKEDDIPGSKGLIFLGKVMPPDAEYPIKGRIIVKKGILAGFECAAAKMRDFYYVADISARKVLFYFNGMEKDTFSHLDKVAIIKKVTKSTDGGALKCAGGSVYVKFPQWAVGRWVMFDVVKGEKVRKITLLRSRDYRDFLCDANGNPVMYIKETEEKSWHLNCPETELPEAIRNSAPVMPEATAQVVDKYVAKGIKQLSYGQIAQPENAFLQSMAFLGVADKESIVALYKKAVKKRFSLEDQPEIINLIRLLRFAPKSEMLSLKEELLQREIPAGSTDISMIIEESRKELLEEQRKQREAAFLESLASLGGADKESIVALYKKAVKKEFSLEDQPDIINLIRLLRFSPKSEMLSLKEELLQRELLAGSADISMIVEESRRELLEEQRKKQKENDFLQRLDFLGVADKEILSALYKKAAAKGFSLEDQPDIINLIRLLRFSPDAAVSYLKKGLLPRLTFLDKAKLVLTEKEEEIFVKMFGHIKQIYVEYKQGSCDKTEALLKAREVFLDWRQQFAAANGSSMEEKIFISILAARLMRIFFQDLKISFEQVQGMLKVTKIGMSELNDPVFQSDLESLARLKNLNDELLSMGWEIRFMKNNYNSETRSAHFISIEDLIKVQEFFQKNNIDFLRFQKGLVPNIPAQVRDKFEQKFGFEISGFLYQQVIGNIRMVEKSEQTISEGIFHVWFSNLRGKNAQLAQGKRKVVLENLDEIFGNGFLSEQGMADKDLGKSWARFSRAGQFLEQAI